MLDGIFSNKIAEKTLLHIFQYDNACALVVAKGFSAARSHVR